jgi:hypothetical protein
MIIIYPILGQGRSYRERRAACGEFVPRVVPEIEAVRVEQKTFARDTSTG